MPIAYAYSLGGRRCVLSIADDGANADHQPMMSLSLLRWPPDYLHPLGCFKPHKTYVRQW